MEGYCSNLVQRDARGKDPVLCCGVDGTPIHRSHLSRDPQFQIHELPGYLPQFYCCFGRQEDCPVQSRGEGTARDGHSLREITEL